IDDELIEPLVWQPPRGEPLAIERTRLELRRTIAAVRPHAGVAPRLTDLGEQRLDLAILAELPRLVLEHQIRAHASTREIPHAVRVLGAVRVRVEVPRAVVPRLLEQLHDEEQ